MKKWRINYYFISLEINLRRANSKKVNQGSADILSNDPSLCFQDKHKIVVINGLKTGFNGSQLFYIYQGQIIWRTWPYASQKMKLSSKIENFANLAFSNIWPQDDNPYSTFILTLMTLVDLEVNFQRPNRRFTDQHGPVPFDLIWPRDLNLHIKMVQILPEYANISVCRNKNSFMVLFYCVYLFDRFGFEFSRVLFSQFHNFGHNFDLLFWISTL